MSVRDTSLAGVRRLLKQAAELELTADAVQRLKWFAYALEHDVNVSLTCRHFGIIARTTFMRWWKRFDASDIASLEDYSRRPHTVRAPETDQHAIDCIRQLRLAHPTTGKVGICALLREVHGIELSVSTVGRVISRHKLFFAEKPSHAQKRGETVTDINNAIALQPTDTAIADTAGDSGALPLPPLPTS